MEAFSDLMLRAYGPYGVAILLLVFLLIAYRSEVRALFRRKPKPPSPSGKDLLNVALRSRQRSRKRSKPINCREKMLADLVAIRYRVFECHLRDLDLWDFEKLEPQRLFGALYSVVDTAIHEAEAECKETGIHPVVIDLFRESTQAHTAIFMSSIRAVCESGKFSTNVERMDMIYNILAEVVEHSQWSVDDQLAAFEQELYGYEYKGQICGDVPPKLASVKEHA